MVSNHVSQGFAARLADQDVTVAEWVLMRALYGRDPAPPSHVAAVIGMTKGAITRLADRLIAKALLIREANADDGRAQTLALTARGVDLVPTLAALADRNDAVFFQCLNQGERATLERLLKQLVANHRITATPVT